VWADARSKHIHSFPDAILSRLPYGVIVLAPDGTVEYVNPAGRRFLAGDSAQELPPGLRQRIGTLPTLPRALTAEQSTSM
jgi:nitrogen fixation/metabolism regulation signal transduction histidine kinase